MIVKKKTKATKTRTKTKKPTTGLPQLTGTPKQIKWAKNVRTDIVDMMDDFLKKLNRVKKKSDIERFKKILNTYHLSSAINEPIVAENMDRIYDKIDYVFKSIKNNHIESGYWISIRDFTIEEITKSYFKSLSIQEENEKILLKPLSPISNKPVKIKITSFEIILDFERNDKFKEIVQAAGFRWGLEGWEKRGIDFVEDKATEIGVELFDAGFPILCDNETVREKIKRRHYIPEERKLVKIKTGEYAGYFSIAFVYDPAIVSFLKKIKGSRWVDPVWVVPANAYQGIIDLEKKFGFAISFEARYLIIQSISKKIDSATNYKNSVTESLATDTNTDINIPSPEGLEYLPYQKAGIAFALKRENTLVADEMGLGKTIQAIGFINASPWIKNVLVICPATLRINWQIELKKWLVEPLSTGIAVGKSWPHGADIVIINYDILSRHYGNIREKEWDLLIVDESHYLKSQKALRTKHVFGFTPRSRENVIMPIPARKKLFLSGTPIVNRPIEIWTTVHNLAANVFPSWYDFVERYCEGFQSKYGWVTTGASNLEELQEKLRASIMVRRLKKDVLDDLPEKRRQVIELPPDGCKKYIKAEMKAFGKHQKIITSLKKAVEKSKKGSHAYDEAVLALKDGRWVAFEEIARLRHETALAKVPYIVEHLNNSIETEKIFVFAHHKDVVAKIAEAFAGQTTLLVGGMNMHERQASIERFQNDEDCRLFIGSTAAREGITLTATAHVVFAELDWAPASLNQIEDRCHRMGQKNAVLVQHLVLEGSLDATMSKMLVAKQEVLDNSLNVNTDQVLMPF
ncbi:MAG: DEAD/DEAH box helicase [Lentisphaerae bacterium]|nr:DEAD/DEAH box helicase [Lentisphaerota bacterium]